MDIKAYSSVNFRDDCNRSGTRLFLTHLPADLSFATIDALVPIMPKGERRSDGLSGQNEGSVSSSDRVLGSGNGTMGMVMGNACPRCCLYSSRESKCWGACLCSCCLTPCCKEAGQSSSDGFSEPQSTYSILLTFRSKRRSPLQCSTEWMRTRTMACGGPRSKKQSLITHANRFMMCPALKYFRESTQKIEI